MPTVLRIGPYEFYFWSNERQEPPHIHVERDEDEAKFWLGPVMLAANHGFRPQELRKVQRLVEENEAVLKEAWDVYFAS